MCRSLFPLAFLALLCAASAQQNLQNDLYECLASTGAEVVLPGDPSYQKARQVANGFYSTYPLAVVYANSVEDVQTAVKCCSKFSVRLIPRSGGHSVMGLSVRQGAVTLDVSRMSEVEVSHDAETATVQTGALLGQVYYAAFTQSGGTKGFPGGVCPNVGVGGHLPGGGVGYLLRKYGLACDQIIGVKMVTADGELVEADANQNQDLLWASCGAGGGSLGVAVEYTVKLVDVPPNVTIFSAIAPIDEAASTAAFYQEWGPELPPELGTFLNIIGRKVLLGGMYLGPAAELGRLLNETGVKEAASWAPGSFAMQEMDWLSAVAVLSNDPYYRNVDNMANRTYPRPEVPTLDQKSKSYNVLQPLPLEALEALQRFANSTPGGWVALQAWGGRMAQVPPDSTAFYWRSPIMNIFYATSWAPSQGPDVVSLALSLLSETQAALSPYIPQQSSYINYLDTDLAAWPRAYWGANAERLQEVKRRYDPADFFVNDLVLTTTMQL